MASLARAGDRPPVRVELADCVAARRDAIEHAIRIELGEATPGDGIVVTVDCAPDDAGVILDVRLPGNPRHYRYALDWHAQPEDARPRLIGLAVAEAVDASRIELTAIAEPRVIVERPIAVPPAASTRTLALVGERRVFTTAAGADLLGVALLATQRVTAHGLAAVDLAVDRATALTSSGVVAVTAVSAAPSAVLRIGGRLHAEAGAGVRLGIVWMRGEALPGSDLAGTSQLRAWLGPFATLAVGIPLTHTITAGVRLELGTAVLGATARDFKRPVAVVDGGWLTFGVAAAIAL